MKTIKYVWKYYRAKSRDEVSNQDTLVDSVVATEYEARKHNEWLQSNNRTQYIYRIRKEIYIVEE